MGIRVTMNETGRLTIPAAIRRQLQIEGEQEFEATATDDGEAVILRPVVLVPRAWVYTDEDLASIERGLRDLREGRERRAAEADFRALAEVADD